MSRKTRMGRIYDSDLKYMKCNFPKTNTADVVHMALNTSLVKLEPKAKKINKLINEMFK